MTTTTKQSCAAEPFTFDWQAFYDRHGLDPLVDLITSSVWVVEAGTVSLGAESIATPTASVFISGGARGESAAIENTIEINGGTYRDCQTLYMTIT